jgi:flagellar motility protein MotE (MotC chaperone)
MKPRLLYGIVFFIAFIAVTSIIYMIAGSNPNLLYIAAFHSNIEQDSDLESVTSDSSINNENLMKRLQLKDFKTSAEDYYMVTDTVDGKTIKTKVEVRYDTIFTEKLVKDPSILDSLKKVERILSAAKREISEKDMEIKNLKSRLISKKDSTYDAWVKSTAKLYGLMDSKQVAKLITDLSDSEVQDLFKKMKTRKVVDILSNLSQDRVSRLTGLR